jgi:hypothetical protein
MLLQGFDEGLAEGAQKDHEIWEAFHEGLLVLFDLPYAEWPLPGRLSEEKVRWDIIEKAKRMTLN